MTSIAKIKNMKPSIIFLFGVLFSCSTGRIFAQNCPEDPETKKGIWVHDVDSKYYAPTVHPETKKNIKAISAELDSIASLFIRYNPQPVGSKAKWYKSFNSKTDSLTSPDLSFTNYQYESLYLPYICQKGVVKPFGFTDTWLFVSVNDYWASGHTKQFEINDGLGEKLFTLPPQRGTLGGYPVFEPIPKGEDDHPWLIYYAVLIHHPGKLPYIPVTKGELFEITRKLVDKTESVEQAAIDRQRKDMGEEWYKKQTDFTKTKYPGMRDNLDKLIKLYQKELNQPAIIRSWEWTLRNLEIADPTQKNLFTTANRGYQLVRANPDYMDKTQAKWKPQYMWVEWWKPLSKKNALALDKVMQEQFDFTKLGDLLTH